MMHTSRMSTVDDDQDNYKKLLATLTEEQVLGLRSVFQCFDRDGNGQLNKYELMLAFRVMGESFRDSIVQDMINEMDCNGDGVIDFEEFVKIMQPQLVEQTSTLYNEIVDAFKIFDVDRNGFVSMSEFKAITNGLDMRYSDMAIKGLFFEFDEDGDGQLNFLEFYELMNAE